MKRRQFMIGAAAGGGALIAGGNPTSIARKWFSLVPAAAAAPDSRVEILTAEPIGTIAPEIYGHFVEHLGGVVYDGIWVGENSRIANIGGLRKSLVEAMKKIKPGLVRWPGGCFADSYDWRD